jgi:hypothetical protein
MQEPSIMEIIALLEYSGGYRGCLFEDGNYVFFQYTRKGRFRRFKSYPGSDFTDPDQFAAMMTKFMRPSAFLKTPLPIAAMTLAELDRIQALMRQNPGL